MTFDIVQLVKEYGAKNLRFRIPMNPLEMGGIIPGIAFKSSSSPQVHVICKINEERYRIADNYKITLEHDVELTQEVTLYCGKEHFYICDFESLMERNPDDYQVYVITIDGFQRLS